MKNNGNHAFGKSNIIRILKLFSPDEKKEFGKYVNSPFNNRHEVSRFYAELRKYSPSFSKKGFSKKKIYEAMYPGTEYRDDVIRRLSSNLFKLAEEFIAYKMVIKDRFEYENSLLKYYGTVNNNEFYYRQLKKTAQYIEKNVHRDANYFYRIYKLEQVNNTYNPLQDVTQKKTDIQKEIDSLWQFTIVSLLRTYSYAIYNNNYFNKKYDINEINPVLEIAERKDFKHSKAIEIYYTAIKLDLDSRNDETFYRLKKLIHEHYKLLSQEDCQRIYNCLLSYCYDMNILPDKEYYRQEFDLISEMLERNILLKKGESMTSEWFMYCFLIAYNVQEIDYAKDFVKQYRSSIPEVEKSNILNHVNSHLAIWEKDFDKALGYLKTTRYNNIGEKLRADVMYLQIYFETSDSEAFYYQADSSKQFIRNEASLSDDLKKWRINFIKYAVKIFKLKQKESDTHPDILRNEILKDKVFNVKWLLKKLDSLKK